MKRIMCIAAVMCVVGSGTILAQTTRQERREAWREARAERRAEEKALEAVQDSVAFQQALAALADGAWVLEADNVVFRNGLTRFVSSNTNYVAVNNGQGTVQTAFDNFVYSPNGLGGVTVQGSINKPHLNRDKEGNVYANFSIFGVNVSATLNLSLTAGTNEASIYITPNFSGNTLTMNGYLYPYSQATIFEGTPSW